MEIEPSEQDDLATISAWMQQLGTATLDGPPAVDPSILWWKAQLLRRWDAERRAAKPIEVGERVQVGIGVVGGIAALVWLWPALPEEARGPLLLGVVVLFALLLSCLPSRSPADASAPTNGPGPRAKCRDGRAR